MDVGKKVVGSARGRHERRAYRNLNESSLHHHSFAALARFLPRYGFATKICSLGHSRRCSAFPTLPSAARAFFCSLVSSASSTRLDGDSVIVEALMRTTCYNSA